MSEENNQNVIKKNVIRGWRAWSISMLTLIMGFILALLAKLTGDFTIIASIVNAGAHSVNITERVGSNKQLENIKKYVSE